jgi:hypothetical protein
VDRSKVERSAERVLVEKGLVVLLEEWGILVVAVYLYPPRTEYGGGAAWAVVVEPSQELEAEVEVAVQVEEQILRLYPRTGVARVGAT